MCEIYVWVTTSSPGDPFLYSFKENRYIMVAINMSTITQDQWMQYVLRLHEANGATLALASDACDALTVYITLASDACDALTLASEACDAWVGRGEMESEACDEAGPGRGGDEACDAWVGSEGGDAGPRDNCVDVRSFHATY